MYKTESERLTILIKSLIEKNIVYNQEDFCKKIGKNKAQISAFKNNYEKKPLDANKLFLLIVEKFPSVNIEWLKTGEGEIFLENQDVKINEVKINNETVVDVKSFLEAINKQADAIVSQQRTIDRLTEMLERQISDAKGLEKQPEVQKKTEVVLAEAL